MTTRFPTISSKTSTRILLPIWPTEVSYASPTLTSAPTTPDDLPNSTRHRRTNRSSSMHGCNTDTDSFEEEDLCAGGPSLCLPPCYNVYLPPSHPLHTKLYCSTTYQDIITELGRENGVVISDVSFVQRKSLYSTDSDSPSPLTGLLTVHRDDPKERGWADFARKIWRSLKGCPELDLGLDRGRISVEIVDERFDWEYPSVFPCQATDDILPMWEDVCARSLDKINDLSGIKAIGCHRIGNEPKAESCSPHILVSVSWECNRNWDDVRDTIIDVLTWFGLQSVGVIIRKDLPVPGHGRLEPTAGTLQVEGCTSTARIGDSIGLHGSSDYCYGTLGGFLELKDPRSGQWSEHGITCFHCVVPSRVDSKSSQSKRRCLSPGQSNDGDSWRLEVDSPTSRDVQQGINELSKQIAQLKAHSYDPNLESGSDADFRICEALSRQIRTLGKMRAEMTDYFENRQNLLGTVFAAPEFRHNVPARNGLGTAMDWALIQPSLGRACGEKDFISRSKILGDECLDFIPRHRNIDRGTRLDKIGRATGETWGLYNGLRTARITRCQNDDDRVETVTMEHTVVYNREGRERSYAKGDDGALVFSYQGLVVGMLVGGESNGDIAYFSHIQEILHGIKEVTGVEAVRLK
ncbi:uncharacterized protein DSM5745_00327 [Aspergillus mulundensis]|uniref:Uncharacterized protein n=1 Tax=Aspergillus mulundensis TaxID=1810919 RepID=A0A3D8T364_9EURO|nr:hypothetical protein DSM5745_00327 [Aspergillus mulundensis]RDW93005.1 hypothetical protein DSM5745_00327 [Aspergillus mulundensis]